MFELTPFVKRAMSFDPFKNFDDMEKSFFGGSSFRTDIKDNGDSYLVEAELPGFKKEDVEVSIENDVMTITAAHNENVEEKDEQQNYVRKERRSSSYTRSFDVSGVNTDAITGSLENGILTLTLPKKEQQHPDARKIELQ